MSAFVVTEAVIDDVVCLLAPSHMDGDEMANKLGRDLWSMNVDAVSQRYDLFGNEEEREYRAAVEAYRYVEPKAVSELQRYNSLRCFTYQCAEGNVPERDLYKRCEKLEMELDDKLLAELDSDDVVWNREREPEDEARVNGAP